MEKIGNLSIEDIDPEGHGVVGEMRLNDGDGDGEEGDMGLNDSQGDYDGGNGGDDSGGGFMGLNDSENNDGGGFMGLNDSEGDLGLNDTPDSKWGKSSKAQRDKEKRRQASLGRHQERKKSMRELHSKQKSIKILMPLGVRFFQDFGGFWRQNGAKLAPKSHQKSIPTSKGDVLKKPYFPSGKTMILKVLGVQVGTKNRSKNEAEMGLALGIDFPLIFVDLGKLFGSKLALKIDLNINQKEHYPSKAP